MKKTFKLAALSILSLLLVGCQKTGGEPKPGSEHPGSSQPGEESKALSLTIKNKDNKGKKKIYLEIALDGTCASTKVEVEVLNSKTDNGYTLSIADDSIASLSDDGTVTAIWAGTTTITAVSKEDPSVKDTIDVEIWDNRNVYERWQDKLAGDIKLEGKLLEIDTIKDADGKESLDAGWTGVSAISEYSTGKYHNELNVTNTDGSTDSWFNMTFKAFSADEISEKYVGEYGLYAITEGNEVGRSGYFLSKDDYINPFIALKNQYEVNESEDDKESFTLKKNASKTASTLQTSLNQYVKNYGVNILSLFDLDGSFEGVNFYEENRELSIDFTTDVVEDNEVLKDGTTRVSHQFVLAYDVTVDAGEASDLQPFEQTEDTLKLQAKLDELTNAKQYKISRSSQPVTYTVNQQSGLPTYTKTADAPTTWDALYKGDELYVGRDDKDRAGILLDSDGKHRYYTYDEANYKDVHDPLETKNGYTDDTGAIVKDREWEKVRPSFFPQYDKVSAAVFDAKENDSDKSIDFTVKNSDFLRSLQMSEYAEHNAAFYLGADNTDKVATYDAQNNSLVIHASLKFNLSESGDLTLSYLLKSDATNATLETYTYDLKSDVTFPTFTEKAPSNLVGGWELAADASAAEGSWEKAGLTLDVSRGDPAGTPAEEDTITHLVLKKGTTDEPVKDISVSNKVISFKLNDGTECSLQMREGKAILTIGEKEYSLVQKGLPEAVTNATTTLNAIDISRFSGDADDASSNKAIAKGLIDDAKTGLADVTTVQGVEDLIDELNEALVEIAVDQVNEALNTLLEQYDDLNTGAWQVGQQTYSDRQFLQFVLNNSTLFASLSSAKTAAEVFTAYDGIMNTEVVLTGMNGLNGVIANLDGTIAEKVAAMSASVTGYTVDPNATEDEKATLQAAKEKAVAVLNDTNATDHDKLAAIYEFQDALDKVLLKYKQAAVQQLLTFASQYDKTNGSDTVDSDYAVVMYYIQKYQVTQQGHTAVQLISIQSSIAGINNVTTQLINLFGNLFANNGIYTIAQKQQIISNCKSAVDAIDSSTYTGQTAGVSDKDTIDGVKTALTAALTTAGDSLDAQLAAYDTALAAIDAVINRIPTGFCDEDAQGNKVAVTYTATNAADATSTKDVVIDGYKIKIGTEDVVNLTITTTGEGDSAVTVITFDTADGKHWKLEVVTGGLTLTELDENGEAKTGGEVWNLVVKQAPVDPTDPGTGDDQGTDSISFHFGDLKLA